MNTKGHCYPRSIILQAVYFKLRFALSYRDVKEIMKMRGVHVDHAAIQRWVYKFSPLMEMQMKKPKVQVSGRWRMDQTYIKIKGQWCYLYRAVDRSGNTVDFLLTKRRQRMSAQSFVIKAISNNCRPRVISIDKSGSNTAAVKVYNKRSFSKIKIRQCRYLNNIVGQDHRFIKRRIQRGLGFKNFESARRTLSGIEVVHMLRKNQMIRPEISMFKSFWKLAS
ncbi:IS6 family transposase [Flavobacterium sp. LPB0248]|uniref:IS6 family transposase n=1 Tax=Flavobacterium sp. LPB0248 TaxID=2614441 RepID=UPI00397794B2